MLSLKVFYLLSCEPEESLILLKLIQCCEGWVDEEILIFVPWNSRKINSHLTCPLYCLWHVVIILDWHSLSIFKDSESLKASQIGSVLILFTNSTVSSFTVTLGSHSTWTVAQFIYLIFDCYKVLKISTSRKKTMSPSLVASTLL